MAKLRISLACRRSERTAAILDGATNFNGWDLIPHEVSDGQKLFSGMLNGQYDAAEFSLAELVHNIASGRTDILGIPVFPTRSFRHGFIFYNAQSGIGRPDDLNGRRIGCRQWVETASVWIRGTLVDEYEISPTRSRWYAVTTHHWETGRPEKVDSPGGFSVNWLENTHKDPVHSAESALLNGAIDALAMVPAPPAFSVGDGRICRLFEQYRDIENAYYQKTRIFPIMHVLVTRRPLVEQHPDLPKQLFALFVEAKKKFGKQTLGPPLVWREYYLSEEKKLFDGDPWAYGLHSNAHVLDKFLQYCWSQGIGQQQLTPKELFFESTWDLIQ